MANFTLALSCRAAVAHGRDCLTARPQSSFPTQRPRTTLQRLVARLLLNMPIAIDMEASWRHPGLPWGGKDRQWHPCRAMTLFLASSTSNCNFVQNLATMAVPRMSATLPAMQPEWCTASVCAVSPSISGIILLPRSHQRRRCAALTPSSLPYS